MAKQIEKNGGRGGMAHVALRVADIQKAFDYLKENGFKIIDKAPRKGSRGTTVFLRASRRPPRPPRSATCWKWCRRAAMPDADAGTEILNLGATFRRFPPRTGKPQSPKI